MVCLAALLILPRQAPAKCALNAEISARRTQKRPGARARRASDLSDCQCDDSASI